MTSLLEFAGGFNENFVLFAAKLGVLFWVRKHYVEFDFLPPGRFNFRITFLHRAVFQLFDQKFGDATELEYGIFDAIIFIAKTYVNHELAYLFSCLFALPLLLSAKQDICEYYF